MKKKSRKFPSSKNLDKMDKVLSKSEGTYILPPDAGAVEKAKYEVCKHILIFMHKKGLTQRQLADKMEVPETRVSEIVHYKIAKFTLDKLVSYYEKINPNVSLSVA
ncbi:MAG: XRE family transcriptional regulator [Bdellovibrionales bacterium]|nr:XRE family transcriptional regulator [Bdellovibrionales bacterium]